MSSGYNRPVWLGSTPQDLTGVGSYSARSSMRGYHLFFPSFKLSTNHHLVPGAVLCCLLEDYGDGIHADAVCMYRYVDASLEFHQERNYLLVFSLLRPSTSAIIQQDDGSTTCIPDNPHHLHNHPRLSSQPSQTRIQLERDQTCVCFVYLFFLAFV